MRIEGKKAACGMAKTRCPPARSFARPRPGSRPAATVLRNARPREIPEPERETRQRSSPGPPASRQAATPPMRWQTFPRPHSRDMSTAIAERSPKAQ